MRKMTLISMISYVLSLHINLKLAAVKSIFGERLKTGSHSLKTHDTGSAIIKNNDVWVCDE
jgi:hypothetical protein